MNNKIKKLLFPLYKRIYKYQNWRMGKVPFFAICLDCDYEGITKREFASLLSPVIIGKIWTGAGTCLSCASYEESTNTAHEESVREILDRLEKMDSV